MTDSTGLVDSLQRGLATVVSPIGTLLAILLSPIDRLLQPFANLFNRTLGRLYGEVTGLQLLVLVIGFAGILTLPLILEWGLGITKFHRALALAAIWAIFAMSWDIQSGYTGYISFGHSVLSGIAGYTTGMVLMHGDLVNQFLPIGQSPPILYTALLSVAAAVILGLLIAIPTLRLRGPYFSLITFVAVLLFMRLIPALSEWTGGESGIQLATFGDEPLQYVFPYNPDPMAIRYYLVAIPAVLIAIALVTIARSNVGLILMAIRENEPAVSAAGINPTKFKIWSFVLSSIPMGIGGVLLAHFLGTVSPQELVVVDNSIEIIAIAVIGGMSSILGPLFAAFGFIFVEEHVLSWFVGESIEPLVLWSLVIASLVFARDGILRVIWHALGAVGGDSE